MYCYTCIQPRWELDELNTGKKMPQFAFPQNLWRTSRSPWGDPWPGCFSFLGLPRKPDLAHANRSRSCVDDSWALTHQRILKCLGVIGLTRATSFCGDKTCKNNAILCLPWCKLMKNEPATHWKSLIYIFIFLSFWLSLHSSFLFSFLSCFFIFIFYHFLYHVLLHFFHLFIFFICSFLLSFFYWLFHLYFYLFFHLFFFFFILFILFILFVFFLQFSFHLKVFPILFATICFIWCFTYPSSAACIIIFVLMFQICTYAWHFPPNPPNPPNLGFFWFFWFFWFFSKITPKAPHFDPPGAPFCPSPSPSLAMLLILTSLGLPSGLP